MGLFKDILGTIAPIAAAFAPPGAQAGLQALAGTQTPLQAFQAAERTDALAKPSILSALSPIAGTTIIGKGTTAEALVAKAQGIGRVTNLSNAVTETGLTLLQVLAMNPGRMKNKVVTVVFTVSPFGLIQKMEALQGKPAMMQSDQRRARSFIKKVSKAAASLPRKTVKESEMKVLQKQLVSSAVQRALTSCPS